MQTGLRCLQWRNAVSPHAKGSRCISTGVHDSDRILCHKAEEIDGLDYRDGKGDQQKHDQCCQQQAEDEQQKEHHGEGALVWTGMNFRCSDSPGVVAQRGPGWRSACSRICHDNRE